MPTIAGALRRLALTPSLRQVSFADRGFPAEPSAATRRLEAIPHAVVCGFDWALDPGDMWSLERRLDLVTPSLRGFAYEGATMALTILDAMVGGTRTRDLLRGGGARHILLAYIGVGFAMARLPRVLWSRVLPDLAGTPHHPAMSWLAVDGYGFDLAYFDLDRWVHRREIPRPYPWLGRADYFSRAVDQGIGRALWFAHGARPQAVAVDVARFQQDRRADLWGGVGLAATFAGGCDDSGLAALAEASGRHRSQLGVGAVFAVRARQEAGHVPSHTAPAVRALASLEVEAASRLARDTEPGAAGDPPYEEWRERIRQRLVLHQSLAGAGERDDREESRWLA